MVVRAMTRRALAIILLCLAACASRGEEPSPTPARERVAFANALFESEDYYRAITEYQRFLFLHAESEWAPRVEYRIAMAYFRGDKLEPALSMFGDLVEKHGGEDIGRRSMLMQADCFYRKGSFGRGIDVLEDFVSAYPADPRVDAARLRMGWGYLQEEETAWAAEELGRIPESSGISGAARALEKAAGEEGRDRKSPAVAGSLSAVLPGAGQLYVSRPRDAAVSFLVNAGFILAAVEAFDNEEYATGALVSLIELSWYTGNIYSAVNSCHHHNRQQKESFLRDAEIRCGVRMSGTGPGSVMPDLAIAFPF